MNRFKYAYTEIEQKNETPAVTLEASEGFIVADSMHVAKLTLAQRFNMRHIDWKEGEIAPDAWVNTCTVGKRVTKGIFITKRLTVAPQIPAEAFVNERADLGEPTETP